MTPCTTLFVLGCESADRSDRTGVWEQDSLSPFPQGRVAFFS